MWCASRKIACATPIYHVARAQQWAGALFERLLPKDIAVCCRSLSRLCFVLFWGGWVGAACYGLSLMEAGVSFFDCPVSLIAKVGPQKRGRARPLAQARLKLQTDCRLVIRRAERCWWVNCILLRAAVLALYYSLRCLFWKLPASKANNDILITHHSQLTVCPCSS